MTIRYENNKLVNLMSHKIIKTRNNKKDDTPYNWNVCCSACNYKFDDGEDRHEWRMYLPYGEDDVAYRNGSFKTTNCHECFVKTMVIWQRTITEALEE
jgi:hypothetical protein